LTFGSPQKASKIEEGVEVGVEVGVGGGRWKGCKVGGDGITINIWFNWIM